MRKRRNLVGKGCKYGGRVKIRGAILAGRG
jgi:hypothetical protein